MAGLNLLDLDKAVLTDFQITQSVEKIQKSKKPLNFPFKYFPTKHRQYKKLTAWN